MALHKEVQVGQVWTCRISDRIVQVKVTGEVEGSSKDRFRPYSRTTRARWQVTNLSTNRITKVTAAKLRNLIKNADGSVSAAEVNRRMERMERLEALREAKVNQVGADAATGSPDSQEANLGTGDGPMVDLHDEGDGSAPDDNLATSMDGPDEDDEHADDDSAHPGYEDTSYEDVEMDGDSWGSHG